MAEGGSEHSLSGGNEEYFEWKCRVCEETGLIKEAIVYCKNCDECFCTPCLLSHNRYNKHHKVFGKKDKEQWGHSGLKHDTGIMCSEHGQTVSMYCGLHCDTCCAVCLVLKHSDRCKPKMSYIPNVAKGIKDRSDLSAVINDNDRLIANFETIAQERTNLQAKINASREECARRIETFHSELVWHLNKLKEESVADMNTKHDEVCKKNTEHIETCRTLERELQDIKEQLTQTGLVNESLLFVKMKNGQKHIPRYKDTSDNLAVLESHSFEFIENCSLQMSVCSTQMLGSCVKVKQNPQKVDLGLASPVRPGKTQLTDADLVGGEGETVKILVTNLPPQAVDEEVLEMFFENKRKYGGGDVAAVELFEEYSAAVIEFEEYEAVQIVLRKKPIVIYKTELELREYNPKTAPQDTVEVHGDFTESDRDILEMHFESQKKSGGDEFESLIIDEDEEGSVAYIKYAKEKVAKRVVAQGTHSISRKQLSVKIYQPEDPLIEYLKQRYSTDESNEKYYKTKEVKDMKKKATDMSTPEPEKGPKTTLSVKVRGMKKVKSEETVQYYFESRRSGGGPIRKIEPDEDDDNVMFITFETETAAKSVSERGTHQVDGCKLSVSLYTPPPPRPIYEDKLLIKGLKPTTTKNCLFNFLEAKSGGNVPTQEQYGEKEGVRLVTFENSIDFERLQQTLTKLEGAELTIARVQVSNCIYVSNYDETLGKDTLELYFEYTNTSGGGQVQKAVFNREEGYWLVYFKDYNVIDSVLSRDHRLGNQKLTVKLFVECLGRSQGPDGEPTLKMPDPITVPGTHPKKIHFILNSHVSKAAVERRMHDCHTTIRWPQTDTKDQAQVKLVCTLTPKTKNCYKLAKEWKQQATGNFQVFLKTITVKQIPVPKVVWNEVMGSLKEITIPNAEAVAVFVEKDQGLVTTVGMKRALEHVASEIQKRIAKIEEQANRDKQKTKETFASMKQLHIKMLLAIKFPSKMEDKYRDFKMKINQNKNEIAFYGIAKDINAVKLEMFEQTNTLAQKTFTDISQQCLDMYMLKQVKEYIVKHLKENNVSAVWEVADNKLVICSTCEQSLGKCASLIRDVVQEKVIPIAPANRSATCIDEWDSLVTDMEGRYPDRVKITVSGMSKIVVTATDDVLQSVVDVVKKFLDANSILDDNVPLSSSITKLLSHHHKQEVDNIAKGMVSDHVQITWGTNGFNINGNQRGVSNAKTQLHNLAAKIQTKDYSIQKSGLGPYVSTSQGRDSIRSVESNLPCVINIKGQDDDYSDDDDFSASDPGSNGSDSDTDYEEEDCDDGYDYGRYPSSPSAKKNFGDIKVFVKSGDITREACDCIVNILNEDLDLSRGDVSQALLKKGGKQLSDQLSTKSQCAYL